MENVNIAALREDAYTILLRLPKEKLRDEVLPFLQSIDEPEDLEAVRRRKHEAFLRLEQLRRPIPDLDEKRELAEWREEKYGIPCAD